LIPGPIVAEDLKQKNQREKEERKRMQMYLTIQSQEIRELKAEITVLKRKDLPSFSQSLSLNSLAHCPGIVMKVILSLLYPVSLFPSYPPSFLSSFLPSFLTSLHPSLSASSVPSSLLFCASFHLPSFFYI
jgi:hypothetical protein